MRIHRGLAGLVAAGALVASAPAALAHDSVIGGNVVADAPLAEFPQSITLEFSGIPKEGFNTFAVTDLDSGEVLFDAEPTIDGRELTIPVPGEVKPGPGDYQVGFQITSSDGHATRGSVPFSVAGADGTDGTDGAEGAAATTAPEDAPAADATGLAGLPLAAKLILGLGGILIIGAVVIMLVAKTRKQP